MPLIESSQSLILVESQLYLPQDRKRRVKDRLVVTFSPQDGDYELEVTEGNGSGRSAMMVMLPGELHDFAQAIFDDVPL